jgi:hypothetical protein
MEARKTSRKRQLATMNEKVEDFKVTLDCLTKEYEKLRFKHEALEDNCRYLQSELKYNQDLRIHFFQELCKYKNSTWAFSIYSIISTIVIIYLLAR